jgi:hypothetical protein
MSRLRSYFRRKTLLRRWPAKLVFLGYVWMCCGGAIPASLLMTTETAKQLTAKDRSVPFPCMDKPCGCRSAEQCFKSCCCSSKAERILWAKEHQLAEEYLALAEQSEEKPVAVKSCCAAKASPSCCATEATPRSCCAPTAPAVKRAAELTVNKPKPAKEQPGVSPLAALRCAGLQVGALGVPVSLPQSFESRLPLEAPLLGCVEQTAPLFSSPVDVPDAPPPRG